MGCVVALSNLPGLWAQPTLVSLSYAHIQPHSSNILVFQGTPVKETLTGIHPEGVKIQILDINAIPNSALLILAINKICGFLLVFFSPCFVVVLALRQQGCVLRLAWRKKSCAIILQILSTASIMELPCVCMPESLIKQEVECSSVTKPVMYLTLITY